MDGIFDNLLHTDRSTEEILKVADQKRAEMIQAASKENEAFDRIDHDETEKLIKAQHEKMDQDRKNELDNLRESVQSSVSHIQSEYEAHGKEWVAAITKRIIEA